MSEQRLIRNLVGATFHVASALWLGLALAGWILVSRPETGKHSHLIGWGVLLAAIVIMLATMSLWIRLLSALFGGCILMGVIAVFTGRVPNGAPFSRPIAAILTALLLCCGMISRSMAKRPLTIIDRVMLVAFLAVFAGGLVEGTPTSSVVGLSVGLCCLLVTRIHSRRNNSRQDITDT